MELSWKSGDSDHRGTTRRKPIKLQSRFWQKLRGYGLVRSAGEEKEDQNLKAGPNTSIANQFYCQI